RNGTLVSNPDINVLAAGSYNYTCTASETQNFTAPAPQEAILTINKAASEVNLLLNGNDVNITAANGSIVNITAKLITPASGLIDLFENGTLLSSGNSPLQVLKNYTTIGTYNITAVFNGTENYTSSFETHFLTITTAPDTQAPGWSNNKTFPTSPATYSPTQTYQFNITWTDNTGLSTVLFEHNFTGVAANYSPTGFTGNTTNREYFYNYGPLAAGNYYWKSHANDTSDNTNSTATFLYTVNKATPTLNINLQPSSSVTYGTTTNASCTASTPQAIPQLFRNGTLVSNPDINVLAAGSYNYTCTASETQNFTAPAPQEAILTITQAATLTELRLNGNRANITITYPTPINATANTSTLIVNLYRNGTLIASGNPATNTTVLAAGTYNYTAVNPGNENYSSSFETWFATINLNITITSPIPNQALDSADVPFNITGTASNGVAINLVQVFVNGSLLGNATTTPPTPNESVIWNITWLPNESGSYTLLATAFDIANNSASTSIVVTFSNTSTFGSNTTIGNGTSIGSNNTVGNNTDIGNNNTIGDNTDIGNNNTIENNNIIGNNTD
ncbi:MAG: hypothetical protein QW308_00005, partial [Candidatus Woesearchaeota archaeon]